MSDHEVTTTRPEEGVSPRPTAPWRVRAGLAVLVVVGVAAVVTWSVWDTRSVEHTGPWAAVAVIAGCVALAALSAGPSLRLHPGVALGLVGVAVAGVAGGVLRPRREVEVIAPDGLSGTVTLELSRWWPGIVLGCALALAGLVLTLVRPAPPSGTDLRARARVVVGACVLLAGGIAAVAVVWYELAVSMWVSGRPARHRGRRLPPETPSGDEEVAGPAGWWREAAADEAASIVAFEDLATRLVAVGAPDELVARAREAARDEVRHARTCTRLSRTVDEQRPAPRPVHPSPDDVVRHGAAPTTGSRAGAQDEGPDVARAGSLGALRRRVEIVGLAVESFADGMAGERFAAARLRAGASTTGDPAVAAWLRAMAVDEERHADLGRDIAAWCREQSPHLVGATLRRVATRLSRETSLPPSQRDADPAVLRRVGLVDQPTAQALWDEVRSTLRSAA